MDLPAEPAERGARAATTQTATPGSHRRLGRVVLLDGVFLAFGGLTLPWLTWTCVANCHGASGSMGVGPLMDGGVFTFTWSWPFWLLLAAIAPSCSGRSASPRADAAPPRPSCWRGCCCAGRRASSGTWRCSSCLPSSPPAVRSTSWGCPLGAPSACLEPCSSASAAGSAITPRDPKRPASSPTSQPSAEEGAVAGARSGPSQSRLGLWFQLGLPL